MSTLITTTAQIGTIKDAGGNATAMTIDSTGRVLKPVIPHGQASCNVVTAATNKIQLTSSLISGGGLTIDQTNERMIVPVSGLYCIGFHHLVDNTTASTTVELRINGSNVDGGTTQTEGNSAYGGPLSVHHIRPLSANDYVEWFVIAGTVHNNTNYNNHYVYLLG